MKRVSRALSLVTLAACLTAAACAPPSNTTTGGANTNAPSGASPSGAASPAPAANAAKLPVTLPVLDAMFQDPAFADELKSRLALTDEQVARLRRVAEEERTSLSEEDENAGSTAEATRRATEKINESGGADKSQQFAALVSERWAGGEGGLPATLPSKPNSVPTDTRIVVNAPAFRMDVFENGQLVKTYRVGIGYPEFPLPQGLRKANQIIFNPTWTPPDEPWVKGKVKPGEKVEAGSKLNPLGPIKIPIGLPSLIHGGKNPARLGTFASHGCVGLTNKQVQDFAVVLARLGGAADVTPESVGEYAKKKTETKNVRLGRDVPVELRYETIVVEDGKLFIFRDVYEKGTNTEENLRAVLAAHGVRLEDLSEPERAQALEALNAMARDPQGNPVETTPTPTPTPKKDGQVRETRTVKGQKEVVIEIAALRGKGYPAAANLDTGGAPQPKPSPTPKKQPAKA
jgi:lipoprotein-anchoring transpeptidase ErfK/SrfK